MQKSSVNTEYTAYTKFSIHRVLHHPKIDCLPFPPSLSSLGRPCCTQFSTLAPLRVHQWIESQLPSCLSSELSPPNWPAPSTLLILLYHGLQVDLQPRSITASCVFLNSHDYGLQVHIITACKWISKLTRSWPPNWLDHGLQTGSIMASKGISTLHW